jgi:phytoene synthase
MDAKLASRLAHSVRTADPDRYFATLFAPPTVRPYLFAFYAFNAEVSRIAESVREPMLGAIRLEFDSSADHFADFSALEDYLDATSGAVMRTAAKILGGKPEVTREAALAYGLTGLVRALPFHNGRHKLYLPIDLLAALHVTQEEFFHLEKKDTRLVAAMRQAGMRARDHFFAARHAPRPGASLAAILPAALVPVYLRKMTREVPIHRRQMALLTAAMRKRL